jgi:single-strand DNA-binding protein
MMPNYSHTEIIGHIGKDAEARLHGKRYAINLPVAVTKKTKDKECTTWWNVTHWSASDRLAQWLTKGRAVHVSGEPVLETYETKDGQQRQRLTLRADSVTLLGDNRTENAPQLREAPANTHAAHAARMAADDLEGFSAPF